MVDKRIIALGFFDGVHRGHGSLLSRCAQMAAVHRCRSAALTFADHPDKLVYGKDPELINTKEDRALLMQRRYGIDEVLMMPFDRTVMEMPWQDFFEMLVGQYRAAGLVCGHDFRFGARGEGDAEKLTALCRQRGIPCQVIPEQRCDGVVISSTYIRELLRQGDVERAARFLGHYHMLSGRVISGRQIGRTLGFPTANLAQPQGLVPLRHGVYACRVHLEDGFYMAVTNVGTRPTVNGSHVTIEPWILDYNGDLYGKDIRLSFHAFLRPEENFGSLERLKAAVLENERQTRAYFQDDGWQKEEIPDVI